MPDAEAARRRMVEQQLRLRGIDDEPVLAAMGRVPRELFVAPAQRADAYADAPLPIGFGQTVSQPYMVALICSETRAGAGSHVLDVGTGSGYQAAVLAELGARVDSIERIRELAELAEPALSEAGYAGRVTVHVGDGTLGLPEEAPFDAIAVGAAAPRLPGMLYEQLAPGGRLVVPVGGPLGQRLRVVVATAGGPRIVASVPCRFVPLVGAEGYRRS